MMASDDFARPLAGPDGDPRRARRRRARRRAIRRRQRVAVLTLIGGATVTALLIGATGGGSPTVRPSSGSLAAQARSLAGLARANAAHPIAARASAARPAAYARGATRAAPSPGSLPQTHAYPSGRGAQFKSQMAALWAGVVHNSLAPALAAFFPKDAYVRLKAIASASSDWTDRLVHDYRLDIAAAHALLGAGAANARLIEVNVPSSYGHWIEPGVCYNSIGYYEMPNARVVYREDGQIRSFGIASMISWRGVWYVVHLGAVLRSTDSGEVDEPASGPGVSAYSGTC